MYLLDLFFDCDLGRQSVNVIGSMVKDSHTETTVSYGIQSFVNG